MDREEVAEAANGAGVDAVRRLLAAGSFGNRVRQARRARGLTLEALSARTGMAKSYLSQIETGHARPPRDEKIRRLAEALGLETEELVALARLSGLPPKVRSRLRRLAEAAGPAAGEEARGTAAPSVGGAGPAVAAAAGGAAEEVVRLRPIPVINKVSAGYPTEFTDLGYPVGIADEYVAVPAGLADPHAFALRVVGDSMEPKYHEGDVVIFSPAVPVASGDDCFVRFAPGSGPHEDTSTFKRVFFDGPDRVRLQPLNERHAPIVVRPEAIGGMFRAVGRYEEL